MNRFFTISRFPRRSGSVALLVACALFAGGCGGNDNGPSPTPTPTRFDQTSLVSDVEGRAAVTDPLLVNAWGIAYAPTGPFWISDNGTGVSTLYNGAGAPFPLNAPLVVTIPGLDEAGSSPTGMVFNGTPDFTITNGTTTAPALFIFDTEDGTIAGWNPTVSAVTAVTTSTDDAAIYKGLASGNNGTGNFIYTTNFAEAKVEAYDKDFAEAELAGDFSDPNIPAGFAPFGIQNIGGEIFVTYAKQDADHEDDVAGAGNGYVDVYDTSGHLKRRLISQGMLNSPWGLVIAPTSFGSFAGSLLVGNFGDGHINAYDPDDGTFVGTLTHPNGIPLVIPGLWGLIVGNGTNAGTTDTVYFTAGPDEEQHGLFGSIHAAD
jgi:uncharacterized protein (TIGR03118 family)